MKRMCSTVTCIGFKSNMKSPFAMSHDLVNVSSPCIKTQKTVSKLYILVNLVQFGMTEEMSSGGGEVVILYFS